MKRTRIRPRAFVAGAILLFGIAGCAAASAGVEAWTGDAAYAWAPGETLRYRLTTEWSSSGGMEEQSLRERRWARIALASTGEGRATAWIEEARREISWAVPRLWTAGPDIVRRPFVLAVGRFGIDSLVTGDSLPREWADVVSDWGSLLPRLPGGPLPAGRTWTDTKRFDLSTDTAWAEPQTRHASYRVTGDSTIRGVPVVVVEYQERRTHEVRQRRPLPPPPGGMIMPAVVLTVSETERGRFYFDARSGRLVRLRRTVAVHKERPSAFLVEEHRQTLELVSATTSPGR